MRRNNDKNSDNHILTLDERAFYIRQSIEGTQRVIDERLTSYKKDGNLEALKIAMDGHVQLGEMLKINELSSYGHDFDYGR